LKKPPLDTTLPYLFYTNVKTIEINKKTFQNTLGETFKLVVQDIHLDTCSVHFQLSNLLNQTIGLHHELFLQHMLVELCVLNCCTLDGLVNIIDKMFKKNMKTISKPLIWINFHKPHIGFNTMLKNSHIYKEFLAANKIYTPQKVIEIEIGNNPSHIIT
jgi:hypothetical protein